MANPKEKMTAFYSPIYNTCVEYWGENEKVLDMLRMFDVWEGKGRVIEDSDGKRYRFELSREFFAYMKSDNFHNSMRRIGVNVLIYN